MKRWIEQCLQVYDILSWDMVAELIRKACLDHDTDLTQREIDIAYGAKDRNVSISNFHFCYSNLITFSCKVSYTYTYKFMIIYL